MVTVFAGPKSIVTVVPILLSVACARPPGDSTTVRPAATTTGPVADAGTSPTEGVRSDRDKPCPVEGCLASGPYEIEFELAEDTCGGLPAVTTREVQIEQVAPGTLVFRFEDPAATWSCSTEGAAVTCAGEDLSPGSTATAQRKTARDARMTATADGFTGTFRSSSSCQGSSCGSTPREVDCHWVYQATGRRDAW